MDTGTVIAIVIAVLALATAIIVYAQNQKTRRLRTRYGPEYDRVLEENRGSTRRAQSVLGEREKRVSKLQIRRLTREEADRFAANWRQIQEGFVDDPKTALLQADSLICEALQARGYPMSDFEQRAADISVEHPRVVENYRTAHDIALRDQRGQATTEDLRRAMQHYRNLFEHVLETHHLEEVHR